jgi:hypothetical protein
VSDRTRHRLPAQKEHPDRSRAAGQQGTSLAKGSAGAKGSTAEKASAGENRTAAEIDAELAATRERLAGTIDTLAERMQPKQLVSRGAAKAKLVVMTPEGRFRTGRVVTVVVAAAAVFGALKLLRGRLHDPGSRLIPAASASRRSPRRRHRSRRGRP